MSAPIISIETNALWGNYAVVVDGAVFCRTKARGAARRIAVALGAPKDIAVHMALADQWQDDPNDCIPYWPDIAHRIVPVPPKLAEIRGEEEFVTWVGDSKLQIRILVDVLAVRRSIGDYVGHQRNEARRRLDMAAREAWDRMRAKEKGEG